VKLRVHYFEGISGELGYQAYRGECVEHTLAKLLRKTGVCVVQRPDSAETQSTYGIFKYLLFRSAELENSQIWPG
jgi:hypothetical protein